MTIRYIKQLLAAARSGKIDTADIIAMNKNGAITDTFMGILIRQRRVSLNRAQYAADRN